MKLIKSKEQTHPFFSLLKHFTRRLFNNDILKYEDDRQEWLVVVMAILAIAGGYISHKLLSPYLYPLLSGARPENLWVKKTIFLTLTMALTGIFSVFNWENIFLDLKDYRNILPLPVKMKTLYAAKFLSVLMFVGLLSAAFNIFSLFIFVFYLQETVGVNIFYFGLSHLLSNFLGNLFIFLAVACIQGFFTLLFRNSLFKRLANMLQAVLLMGFIWVIVWLPQLGAYLPTAKQKMTWFFYCFPPLWFTGINEGMVGAQPGTFAPHILTAFIAIILTTALYWSSFPLTLKRYVAGSLSAETRKNGIFDKTFSRVKKAFNALFLKNPIQRGVFYFVIQSFKRSRKHRLQLVMYLSIPAAYIIADLVYFQSRKGWAYFHTPNFFLIGVSLICLTFLAAGIRMIVRHPVMLKANWVFRMTESKEKKHYFKGIRKVFIFLWGIPFIVGVFAFYTFCWGVPQALFHTLYSTAIFFLLLEVLFYSYNRIPFTGEFEPGKPNIKLYWPLILGGFLEALVFFSFLGLTLLKHPGYYLLFFISAVSCTGVLAWKRYRRYKSEDFQLVYDDEPMDQEFFSSIAR